MGKYTNATRHKQCPECGEWFDGDETVKGELCPDCQQTKAYKDASEEE